MSMPNTNSCDWGVLVLGREAGCPPPSRGSLYMAPLSQLTKAEGTPLVRVIGPLVHIQDTALGNHGPTGAAGPLHRSWAASSGLWDGRRPDCH